MSDKTLFSRTLADLRRRKVFRVAMAYLVGAWLLVEVSSVVLPALQVPETALTYVVVAAMAGFPVTLLLAWIFDVTPDGIVRTGPAEEGREAVNRLARRGIDVVVLAVLLAIIGYLAYDSGRFGGSDTNRSIAVLPFEDLSEGGANEYFSDGLSEEVLNSLVGVDGLRVAARTSSWAFKDRNVDIRRIGEQLDVDTVLEGSVRKDGDRVRIAAKLISADDGFQIWSKTYERPFDDIFAIQDEIARSIVDQLELEIIGADGAATPVAADIGAWDLYLKGRHHWHQRTPSALEEARGLFEDSIAQDPEFALAYAGLADTYLLLSGYGELTDEAAISQAEPLVARALALDTGLAEAYASLGLLRLKQKRLDAAELALRQATQLNPGYSMAHMWLGLALMETAGPEAALKEFRAARKPDPLHPAIAVNTANALAATGDYEAATQVLETVVAALQPMPEKDRERFLVVMLAKVHAAYGHYDEAILAAREAGEQGASEDMVGMILAKSWLALGESARATEALGQVTASAKMTGWADFLRVLVWTNQDCASCLREFMADRAAGAGDSPPGTNLAPGMAAHALGDWEQAERWLSNAADNEARLHEPAERALIYSLVAHARDGQGDTAGAQEALRQAEGVLERARHQGWQTPQLTAAAAVLDFQQDRTDSGATGLVEAVEQGWREYWLVKNHPVLAGLDPQSAPGQVLNDVRGRLEVMRASALSPPATVAGVPEAPRSAR
jgi:TolB-like protein/tetratricopeptide (TPR) repeat protein